MIIPNHVANYSVFKDGRRLIGCADITLPNLQNLNDSLKGSGIFGEIDMPVQAHFQALSVTVNWLTITDGAVFATIQDGAQLDAWAALQAHNSGTGKIIHEGWRFIMTTVPKSFNLGKLEVGAKEEAVSEYELVGIRCLHNDVVMFELNKENGVCRWSDGTQLIDTGRRIRQLIGL
jgi:Bacteriophage tail tube protein